MKAPSLTSRVFMALGASLLLLLSATLAWGVVSDYQVRGLVPNGVTVVGQDFSGMTESQARTAIKNAVSAPMLRPVTVTADGRAWLFDPEGVVTIDTESMLSEAYSTRRSATFVSRLDSQLRGTPLPNDVKPMYSVDNTAVAAWVAEISSQIDRKSIDASRTLAKNYTFKIKRHVFGAKVNRPASTQTIVKALGAEAALKTSERSVALTVKRIKPKVLVVDFKTALIVSLSQCRIRLYKGDKLVKSYLCAPGRAAFPTPTGDFKIQSKQRYAPWINPGTPWAASMPAVIPGGPGNPMGVTKIGITWPGVFMHGVPPGEYGSIGTHASHGCMRMMPAAVLDLFHRVKIGDPVYIRN